MYVSSEHSTESTSQYVVEEKITEEMVWWSHAITYWKDQINILEKQSVLVKSILLKISFLKMSLTYKPGGPIPGYKRIGFYAGWAYMRGNRV